MPEADYLRLTALRLAEALGDQPLVRADLRWPTIATYNLIGRRLISASSYGKHLLLRFDDGRTLHVHLRMEGLFRIVRSNTPAALGRGHDIRAVLATAQWTALGKELGMLDLLPTGDEQRLLKRLGPEILAPDFWNEGAIVGVANLNRLPNWPICAALLEQTVVAGIGTIWMAESLWVQKIYPWALVSELTDIQKLDLLRSAHRQITRSVQLGSKGGLGAVPRRVHGKHQRFCVRCGSTPIKVSALSGPDSSPDQGAFDRVVFWCPECQKPPQP